MKHLLIILTVLLSFGANAQSDDELATMIARICKLDSVDQILGQTEEGDSLRTFNFLTLDYEEMGAPVYDFDKIRVAFDLGSNLLMAGKPYGKIELGKFSKSKGEITVILARVGDRTTEGKWTYATYNFTKPKNGKWLLAGSKYYFTEK